MRRRSNISFALRDVPRPSTVRHFYDSYEPEYGKHCHLKQTHIQPSLLLNFISTSGFRTTTCKADIILRGTISGFVSMFSAYTLEQLNHGSFMIVLTDGKWLRMSSPTKVFQRKFNQIRRGHRIQGFYIDFAGKTMAKARAYFPSLSLRTSIPAFTAMCPMRAHVLISSLCAIRKSFLIDTRNKRFTTYTDRVSGISE